MADSIAGSSRSAGFVQGIVLLLPCTMAVMGVLVLAPVLPAMMEVFKGVPNARFWTPAILTTPALCLVFLSPLAGALGDRFGRRRLLIWATVFYAGFGMAPIFLDNLYAIILTRVGVGACEAAVLTLSTALLGDVFKGAARDRWLAAQTAVASLAAIACLVAGGVLGSVFGWRGPFALYGLVLFLALAVARFTWEPDMPERPAGALRTGLADLPWAALIGICLVSLVGSVLFYTVQIQMSVGLSALGVRDPARIGLMTALASLGVPVGTVVFQLVIRRPTVVLLAIEFMILGASYVAMSAFPTPKAFVAAATVNLMGAGMLFPTLLTWAIRQFRYESRGLGTGIWQGVFSAGQFISGVIMAELSISMGGVIPSFKVLGLAGLLCSLASLLGWGAGRLAGVSSAKPAPVKNGGVLPHLDLQ